MFFSSVLFWLLLTSRLSAGCNDDEDEYISNHHHFGVAKVSLNFLRGEEFHVNKKNYADFGRFLVFESLIPANTTEIEFKCELSQDRRRQLPIVDIVGQDTFKLSQPSCNNYIGLAKFQSIQPPSLTAKCFVSLCQPFQHGTVWLPSFNDDGDDSQIYFHFQLDDQLTTANFTSPFPNEKINQKLQSYRQRAKFGYVDQREAENWAKQLVTDIFPENWLHVRLAILVTVESFQSDTLKNDTSLTLKFLSSVVSLVNIIYSQLNISVNLARLIIWTSFNASAGDIEPMSEDDWYDNRTSVLKRLTPLAENKLWPRIGTTADYIAVVRNLDRQPRTGQQTVLGLANLGTICRGTWRTSRGASSVFVISSSNQWTSNLERVHALTVTFAHELGHAFGIEHDANHTAGTCYCETMPLINCVMWNAVNANQIYVQWSWSNCSRYDLAKYLQDLPPLCLKEIPDDGIAVLPDGSTSPAVPTCGNGVVEDGEDCDCGPKELQHIHNFFCPNVNCCNQTTCKLTANVECAHGPCCNASTCSFQPENTICREAKSGGCDLLERCNGTSFQCPVDRYMMTGTACRKDGSCYEGKCLSRNDQCMKLMGTSKADKICYLLNRGSGTITHNCGHEMFRSDYSLNRFIGCVGNNIYCGNLLCKGSNRSVINRFTHYDDESERSRNSICSSLAGYMLPDYGHVPDGMLCANDSLYCLNQRCSEKVPVCKEPLPCDNFGKHVGDDEYSTTATIRTSPTTLRPTTTSCPITTSTTAVTTSTSSSTSTTSLAVPTLDTKTTDEITSSTSTVPTNATPARSKTQTGRTTTTLKRTKQTTTRSFFSTKKTTWRIRTATFTSSTRRHRKPNSGSTLPFRHVNQLWHFLISSLNLVLFIEKNNRL